MHLASGGLKTRGHMSVIRVKKHESNFVVLYKEILENPEISLKAKGLWAFCMSKPDDWVFEIAQLQRTLKEGEKALISAIDELIQFGYCFRVQPRGEKGMFEEVDYEIYELSQLKESLHSLKESLPEPGLRAAGYRVADNAPILNNKKTKDIRDNNTPLSPQPSKPNSENVAVFSEKEGMKKRLVDEGRMTQEHFEHGWKYLENFRKKGGEADNPPGMVFQSGRENWEIVEDVKEKNTSFMMKFEKAAERIGKSFLVQANPRVGYLLFTDGGNKSYSVDDSGFIGLVTEQGIIRGIIV